MALGEAFINVRADVKPFARDLEKGIKDILRAAERKIAADPNLGRRIGDSLGKGVKKGLGDGVEDGMDDGFRRGSRKATRQAQNFIATIGDFLDDGLSAIPPQVKAAIVIGIAAAAVVIAPLLGGVISASIISGATLGAAALGTILAFRLNIVQRQLSSLGQSLLDKLTTSALPLVRPILEAAEIVDQRFGKIAESIQRVFGQIALDIVPLTEGLVGFIDNLTIGFVNLAKAARPVINALAETLPELGLDISAALTLIADSGPEAALALRDFIHLVGLTVIALAALITALSKAYYAIRVFSAFASGDFQTAIGLMVQHTHDAYLASGQLEDGLTGLDTTLSGTASEALAARLAIYDLAKTMLAGLDAAIDYEQAIDDLAESIRDGNKDFRITEENGRKNLRLIKAALNASARQRDQAIADSAKTGQSIDQINAKYESEIREIEKVIGKNAAQSDSLKEVFDRAHALPGEVAIEVKTPGLQAALEGFRKFGAAAARAASIAAAAIATANGGGGLKTATQYALGGIVDRPTAAVIGEAGYKEAVIPDPSVMPQRAMALSNQFGLTSMIANALGAGRQVINVYLGTERLDERVDYRIGYNNQIQASMMSYGPRT